MSASRPLRLLDVVCIGVNTIVGSSIFLFPGRLAAHLGPASIIAFGLTGLLLITVGLCFAEAASRFDRPGGPYLYAREAFGDTVGFGIGWMCFVTQVLSWAAVANAIAVYLGHFGEAFVRPAVVKGMAAAVILALGALNYRGVRLGAWTSNVLTAGKLLPLGVFLAVGLPQVEWGRFSSFAPNGWAPLGPACFLAYFSFQGFEAVPVPSGEVERPQRNVPIAVVASISFAAFLYMAIQTVAVGVHPGLAGAERPLADAAALVLGPAGAAMIVLGAVISTTGYNSSTALVTPRYLVALAQDGHLPAAFAGVHPRYGTPHAAVAVTTAATLAFAMVLDFDRLVDFSNVVVCAQYISTCLAVPILRRGGPGALRLPGGLFFPAAGIAVTFWLGLQGETASLVWAAGLCVLGFVLRAAARRSVTAAAPIS